MNLRYFMSFFQTNPTSAALLAGLLVIVLLGLAIMAYVGIRAALDVLREKRAARIRREMRRVERERQRRRRMEA
jgi:hypothetical protein